MTITEPVWPAEVPGEDTWPIWQRWELPEDLPVAPMLPPFPERRFRELTEGFVPPPVEPPDPALLARVLDGLRRL